MLSTLLRMIARLLAFVRPDRFERDLDEELQAHLAMLTDDNISRGMTPEQARRAASIRVGGLLLIKEQHRDARGLPAVESVLQDLRFAFRMIARDRWFSAIAIAALALGIGVNAIGFTLVHAAFLRGLPFADAGRLLMVAWQPRSGTRSNVSHTDLQDMRAQSRTFTDLAAFADTTMNLSDDRALPEEVRGAWVTANAFGVLRQQPHLGRDFASSDGRKGAEPVVIIGHTTWKTRYGGDPSVLGSSLRLNGQPATIIGVMPDGMKFPSNTEVWAPFIPTDAQERRSARILSVFGRLRDAATRVEAQAELNGLARQLAAADPDTSESLIGARVETFTERYVGGNGARMFRATMGAVVFVLLIACANVANLLLSRAAYRAREIAARMALGATRRRIVRQLLIESVVLGVIGGSGGLLLALFGVEMIDAAVQDPAKPYWIVFTIDWIVFAYVAAICVFTGILFGFAPALHVSKTNMSDVLKEGGRGTAGTRRARVFSGALVVAELALTVVLLAGAGLMIRSFLNVYTLDIGIRTDHLMAMRMRLPDSKYVNADARRAFYGRLEARVAAIAGIDAIALTTSVPGSDTGERVLEVDGTPPLRARHAPVVGTVMIGPQFFDVVGRSLLRGRSFQERDGAPGSETVIVNERLATQIFPGRDPIGTRIRFTQPEPTPGEATPVWRTIIGVSPSIRHGSPRDIQPDPIAYLPSRQDPPDAASLLIRSRLPPAAVMDAVRREVQAIDQDQPVFTIQTLDQTLAQARWPFRLFGSLFAIFAVIALVLSSIGLYGVTAYSVTRRTQEMGVRMALGAEAWHVSWLILKLGLAQLAIGLTVGLGGAWALSRVLRRMLVQITPNDPVTFAAITILLTGVSLAACLLPARRAIRVDPMIALRAE